MQRLLDGQMMQMTSEQEADFIAEQAAAAAPPTKDALKARAALMRYRISIGTTTVNGYLVNTDGDARANLTGAALGAQFNSALTLPWKMADGTFAMLTASQVIALAQGVMAFVAGLFVKEQSVAAEIDAGTITTFDQVDAAITEPASP